MTLTAALGTEGVVRKTRHVFLTGQTRIHLDEVDGLEHFVEIEVVLQRGQKAEDGVKMAQDLMTRLEIREEDLIGKAYVDLLKEQEAYVSRQSSQAGFDRVNPTYHVGEGP